MMKDLVVLDLEVYPNYTLFAFKNIDNDNITTIEIKGESNVLDDKSRRKLNTIIRKRITFGFNSRNYDLPIILYSLNKKTAKEICDLSNFIIENNSYGWQTLQKFNLFIPKGVKHFDIQEPSPGIKVSLKLYGARLHSKKLQDLPIEPNTILTEKEIEETKLYCINDLDTTIDLYNKIKDRINLRVDMSKIYNSDLLSKSDAQIAEVVIKSELSKKTFKKISTPKIPKNAGFNYDPPKYISFENIQLCEILEFVSTHSFELDTKGSIKLPKELRDAKINIGNTIYQMGIGGIHSTEKKQSIIPTKDQVLVDKDVASYYPSIILNEKLYPKHLGPSFLNVYKKIVDERLKAKKEKNKIVNESLKIVINGSFGKLGNKYSALYSPNLMIAVTLTGQLSLLMLIEKLEKYGINVISANTDGFVSVMDKNKYDIYDSLCLQWELETGFNLEETRYKALYSRDVNNYLAIPYEGEYFKGKGIFTLNELSKNPQADICVEAVINYLSKGKSIKSTITDCKDVTKFLYVRSVNGGAIWKDQYLGRVVRWIYSKKGDIIKYKKPTKAGSIPKVAKSENSRPIMDLNCEFPKDLDYERYIYESFDILDDLGLNL